MGNMKKKFFSILVVGIFLSNNFSLMLMWGRIFQIYCVVIKKVLIVSE